MFKHGSHDSSQAEGRLDDAWSKLFFHNIDYLLFEADMFFGKFSFSTFNWYFNLTFFFKSLFKSSLLFLASVLDEGVYRLRILFELFAYYLPVHCYCGLLLRPRLFEFARG